MTDRTPRVLIVDDDAVVAESIADHLASAGYDTTFTASAKSGLDLVRDAAESGNPNDPFNVIIVDMVMPEMSGLELIRAMRTIRPEVVPIVITGYGTIEAAVKSVRYGAIDYLMKPLAEGELRMAVEKAVRQQALLAENFILRSQLDLKYGLDNIVGTDPRMRRIYEVVGAVAPSRTTVLMSGESGTGKSLIARAIHRHSSRKDRPFVEISCGSIPETLLESELFGHVRGAFTGAHADKAGRFLAAHTGTLFLDEINSASPGMQLKLLRVIQERTFEAVGSNEPVEVDVRVILASNQPLEDLVASGEFRQDLYYRINVVMIQLPPLRERASDIPALAEHFLQVKAKEAGKQVVGFADEALEALQRYAFPGNVRELENIVERAVVLSRATRIGVGDLPGQVIENSTGKLLRGAAGAGEPSGPGMTAGMHAAQGGGPDLQWTARYRGLPLQKALEEPEKQLILAALEANDWNRQQTADVLQINRTTLYKKMKQHGLEQYGRTG